MQRIATAWLVVSSALKEPCQSQFFSLNVGSSTRTCVIPSGFGGTAVAFSSSLAACCTRATGRNVSGVLERIACAIECAAPGSRSVNATASPRSA